ncbi:MAG TPA: NAD-dependent epimerase/dehydratase family protein [Rubrobacteraceae bacterium]|nr:NAD-dependent epimerase/dehydratase family protein [Rubrobacteraceae bacterium]
MPERVLITGATGFVGSHIARAFAEAGYEVRIGARASSDQRWISDLYAERVLLDVSGDPEDTSRAVRNVDTVVHAAGITRAKRARDYYAVNAGGARRLAVAAFRAGVRRFVLVSSLAARGPDGRGHPASDYGWSKLEAERHLRALDGGMETVVLRPAAVYGPRDTDLLPLFRLARAGWLPVPSGAAPLQPVYAEDAARAVVLAASCEPASFGPFPVAENSRYGWPDVVAGLWKVFSRPVRAVRLPAAAFVLAGRAVEWSARPFSAVPLFDERRARDLALNAWTCDVSETEKALGWRARIPLVEGLERTATWYGQAGWLSMKSR